MRKRHGLSGQPGSIADAVPTALAIWLGVIVSVTAVSSFADYAADQAEAARNGARLIQIPTMVTAAPSLLQTVTSGG